MSKKSIKFDCSTCYYNNGDVCINHCSTLGKFKFDPYGYSISDLLEFKYKCDGYRPSLDTYDFVKKNGLIVIKPHVHIIFSTSQDLDIYKITGGIDD